MPSTDYGSVAISVDFNISDAEKELARLKKRVFKLEDEIGEKSFRRSALSSELVQARKELKKLQDEEPATLIDGQFADNSEYYKMLNDAREKVSKLSKELEAVDAEIDKQNISLEWTKQRYGEIAQEAERIKSTQETQTYNPALKTAEDLKAKLKELEGAGKWFGDKDYDEVYGKLLHINEVVKDHKRDIMQTNAYMEEMADSAGISDEHIASLGQELSSLQGRMKELKRANIGFGHQEYDDISARIAEINRELKEYKSSLLDVPDDGRFQELADSAHVADEYIDGLAQNLSELKAQKKEMEAAGLGLGIREYDEAVAQIAQISQELREYKDALTAAPEEDVFNETAESAEIANQHIVDLNEELATLKERQKELSAQGIGLGFEEFDKNTSRIAEITQKLKEYQKSLSEKTPPEDQSITAKLKAAEKMGSILQKLSQSLGGSGSVGAGAASTAEGLSAATTGMEGLTTAAAAAGPVVLGVVAALALLKMAANKIAEEAKKLVQSFVSGLKKGLEVLKKFSKAAVEAFRLATAGVLELLERVNVFPKMFSSIGKSLKGLGRTLKSALVFSVIYKGLSLVRQQMGAYLMVNAQFSTALRRLQGVLLTAFQPIYEVVVPALTTLINVLSRAIAAVTQFVAVLFGKTAKQAQTNAKGLYEQASATTAAGNAAEDAAKQMAAFDEINKLEGNKSAGGGGGGGAVNTGPLFDWEYEDTPFPDWGEAFSAFLDKLLGNIPKLKEAFKDFADWLNNLTKKLYDMFTFPGVLEKVKQLGRDLADALNYLVNQINWYQLGQALGAGLNLALNFLTSFLYGFDWMNLGQHLAEMVNGLASEIDWYEFGRLLWSGFKIGLETLAGFILGLDMPLMAQAASSVVIGFFTEMKNTIQRIPWGEIGRQIADFLVNLDWYGMLSAVTSAIAAGLMAAVAAVRGFLDRIVPEIDRIAKEIVQALIEFFRDKVEWDKLAQSIGDGIAAALHFVAGLLNPELFYEIGSAIGKFLINLPWVEIFGGLAEALANGINSAIAFVRGLLDQMTPEKLREIADGIAEKINQFVRDVEWDDLGKTLSDGIEAALDFMIELMEQIDWDAVGAAICEFLENVDWDTLLTKWGTLLGETMNAKMKVLDLSGAVDVGWNIVKGIAKGIWEEFEAGGGITGWLKRVFIDKLIGGVKDLFGIHSPSTVFAEIGRFLIEGLKVGLSEIWHNITEFFAEKLNGIKDKFSETWGNIKTATSEKFGGIKQSIIDIMEKLKTHDWGSIGSKIVNGIKNGLESAWKAVTEWASGAANWLKNKFEGAKNAVSNIRGSAFSSGGGGRYSARSMPDISTYRIPALAQGAVIPPNREFLAVLGDQRSGTNIETPVPTMIQAFKQALKEVGMSGGNQTVILEVDGRELGRATVKFGGAEYQRIGTKLVEVRG